MLVSSVPLSETMLKGRPRKFRGSGQCRSGKSPWVRLEAQLKRLTELWFCCFPDQNGRPGTPTRSSR